MNLVRRLRGVVGTMGTWATVFAVAGAVGLVPLELLGRLGPFERGGFLRMLALVSVRWACVGAGMGLAFATAIMLGERRRVITALSPRRFAAWGFAAGAIVPMGMAAVYVLAGHSSVAINLRTGVIFAGICGVVGAGLAAVSLRAARRVSGSLNDAHRVRTRLL
jgi:hypothetical protein